jgi:hypothetical protein
LGLCPLPGPVFLEIVFVFPPTALECLAQLCRWLMQVPVPCTQDFIFSSQTFSRRVWPTVGPLNQVGLMSVLLSLAKQFLGRGSWEHTAEQSDWSWLPLCLRGH